MKANWWMVEDVDEQRYRLRLWASREVASRAFVGVLARPCSVHGVGPGEPCWAVPRGVCGARVRRWSDRRIASIRTRGGARVHAVPSEDAPHA